jgi:glycosyltransferase involved in cell wall biosynthesis
MATAADEHYHYRAIWLSDIHLGTPGCRAYYLLDFLRAHRADTIYLVGDILDGWQLQKRHEDVAPMKIALVTDAWEPQVNGVVRTLKNTARELGAMGHAVELLTPQEFRTLPCPTYPDIRLSLLPGRRVARRLAAFDPDAIHIATEGPLGLAARHYATRRELPFTTAYHTRFPEYIRARTGLPLAWTYRLLRWFHGPSRAVMAPTPVVRQDLEAWGVRNVVLWSRGVDLDIFRPMKVNRLRTGPPIFLYVGRVAIEKNIEAFLALDLPGSKWVAGEGPAMSGIRARFPDVNYLGVLDQHALAEVYASADVFVFPSRTDTFGLVLLEAMACGLPVAAYPVTGPLDVIGDSKAGAMHEDLRTACLAALELKREDAAAHARKFSWRAATEQFLAHLYPRRRQAGTRPSAGPQAIIPASSGIRPR